MTIQRILTAITGALLGLCSLSAHAVIYDLPRNGDNVVGEIITTRSQPGERLGDVGRRFDVGYFEMIEANPGISPDRTLRGWTKVVVPSRYVLPPGPRKGIVINLAELRLYYYTPDGRSVLTEPVGIGREGWATPLGTMNVSSKQKNPSWRPTDLVKAEAAKEGYILPDVWPPGPDNPLGKYKMRLSGTTYLIHGTNRPSGVGKRSSAGCIRMFPEGIEELYPMVGIGTSVRIISRPIKVGWQDGIFYLEAHKPLKEKGKYVKSDTVNMIGRIHNETKSRNTIIKWREAHKEVKEQTGIPIPIGSDLNVGFFEQNN